MKFVAVLGALALVASIADAVPSHVRINTGNKDKFANPAGTSGTEWQTSAYFAPTGDGAAGYHARCVSHTDPREFGVTKSIKTYEINGETTYAHSYGVGSACSGKVDYHGAVSFCAQFGGRLPTFDELRELKLGTGSGCGYDKYLIWTSTPYTIPDPRPVSSDSNSMHQVRCGSAGGTGEACKVDGVDYTKYDMPDTELHGVRCCANFALPWASMQRCYPESGDYTTAASNAPYFESYSKGQCHRAVTYDEAKDICEDAGARLCNIYELDAGCGGGTGCELDRQFVWSSTPSEFKAPIVESEADHFLACRTKNGSNCRDSDGAIQNVAKANGLERHAVTCCATSDLGWRDMRAKPNGMYSGSYIPDPKLNGDGRCRKEATWAEANDYCTSNGAELCTLNQVLTDYASSSGCQLDNSYIWTKDLYEPLDLSPTTKEHRLVCGSESGSECDDLDGDFHYVFQASDEEKRAVRCCSDDPDLWWVHPDTVSTCEVWGGSELPSWPYYNIPEFKDCHMATHWEAKDICEKNGGRLCTVIELANGCTSNSGCSFNKLHIWSADENTPSTAVTPSNGFHQAACGNPANSNKEGCQDVSGRFYRSIRQPDSEKRYPRCCTEELPDFIEAGSAAKNSFCNVWVVSELPIVPKSHGRTFCPEQMEHWEAENLCALNDMRLCTENEIERGCARSGTCKRDKEWIWSGTESCQSEAACALASREEYRIGCYASTETFPQFPFVLGPFFDIEECYQACMSAGYAYFGMRNGDICSCGDDYETTVLLPPEECNLDCISGPGKCGGETCNTIFSTGLSVETGDNYEDKYFGCFYSDSTEVEGANFMSIVECVDSCIDHDFAYAALGNGGQCYCQDDKPKNRAGDCTIGCHEGRGLCGGPRGLSFYRAAPKAAIETLGLCKGSRSSWWGDPHLITFDGLAYNCQGVGHFILSHCPEYELQAKFKPATFGKASVTDGIAAKYKEYPVVEISIADFDTPYAVIVNDCPVVVTVGETLVNQTMVMHDTIDITLSGNRYEVQFPEHGPALTAKIRKGRGCLLDVDVCVTAECARTVVGLLGTPDGDKNNEWMKRSDSSFIPLPKDYKNKGGYEYCTQEWCVYDENDSLFTYHGTKGFDDYDACSELFPGEMNHDNVSDEDKERCKHADDEESCLDEAEVGGSEAVDETLDNDMDLDNDDGPKTFICELPDYTPFFSVITSGNCVNGAKNTYTGFAVGGEYFIDNNNQIGIYTNANGLPVEKKKSFYRLEKKKTSQSKFQGDGLFIKSNDPLKDAGIDWAQLIWLAENVKDSDVDGYKVRRITSGGQFHQEMFIGDVTDDPQGQKTLIFFDTTEDIELVKTPSQKGWGPCVIAPKAKVTLKTPFADGFIYAKTFIGTGTEQQLHGDLFDGKLYCDEVPGTSPPTPSPPTKAPTPNPTMAPVPCPYSGDASTDCPLGGSQVTTRLRKGEPLEHMPAGADLIYNLQIDGDRTDRTVSFKVDNPFSFPVDVYVQYETRVGQFSTDPACEAELAKPACDASGATLITAACDDHPHFDRPPYALVNVYYVSKDASFLSDGYITNDDGYIYECCDQEEETKGDPLVHYSLRIDCGCPTAIH